MAQPRHIAIIADGNRRWAVAHGKKPIVGHKVAVERTINLALKLREDKEINVDYLTLWGFSTENWKRSKEEVQSLMNFFYTGLKKVKGLFTKHKIKLMTIGRRDRLPRKLVKLICEIEEATKHFSSPAVCLALDYGGRDEILRAVNKAIKLGKTLKDGDFDLLLDTNGIPNPDMIIRTGGEKRLSGFLPWQGAYAELFFVKYPYPELDIEKLKVLINEFERRVRTFGGTAKKKGYEKYK